MTKTHTDNYTLKIRPGTRDYRGFFVQDTTYRLESTTDTGWAHICLTGSKCYYVDPANLDLAEEEQQVS
ncbi:MAG: hypothetical protein AAFN18_10705 [Cyanobacteria bacterium J06554_6]